jgi:hypothetical protein
MGSGDLLTNVVKGGEGLENSVSNIFRRYTDCMRFAADMTISFFVFYIPAVLFYIIVYVVVCFVRFCLILNKYYIMDAYWYLCSVLCVLFYCVVLWIFVCVNIYSNTGNWYQTIAVNKYVHHIISRIKLRNILSKYLHFQSCKGFSDMVTEWKIQK